MNSSSMAMWSSGSRTPRRKPSCWRWSRRWLQPSSRRSGAAASAGVSSVSGETAGRPVQTGDGGGQGVPDGYRLPFGHDGAELHVAEPPDGRPGGPGGLKPRKLVQVFPQDRTINGSEPFMSHSAPDALLNFRNSLLHIYLKLNIY